MSKAVLSPSDHYDLRASLQISTLEALMRSRRWEPGDLIFQGGTSLSLVYRSPRFSEDLDFLVLEDLNLTDVNRAIEQRLEPSVLKMHPLLNRLVVGKNRDEANPHNMIVSASGSNLIGSVKVKVQMWKTSASAMQKTRALVSPVWTTHTDARAGKILVPTSTPGEIYADKIKAIADRPYLKGRDVFDLYWLTEQKKQAGYNLPDDDGLKAALQTRLETYPGLLPEAWLEKAFTRIESLEDAETIQKVKTEMQKWLPSYWPLNDETIASMIRCAKTCMQKGCKAMQSILAESSEMKYRLPREC